MSGLCDCCYSVLKEDAIYIGVPDEPTLVSQALCLWPPSSPALRLSLSLPRSESRWQASHYWLVPFCGCPGFLQHLCCAAHSHGAMLTVTAVVSAPSSGEDRCGSRELDALHFQFC